MNTINVLLVAALVSIGAVLIVQADVSHLAKAPTAEEESKPVTDVCLGCICEAVSGCNRTLTCNGDVCGLFRITWAYWADSGKPTLQGEPQTSETAYGNCVNDAYCAARAVQGYMNKFGQDCNGDSVINCYDHAAIHLLGGYGCRGELQPKIKKSFEDCLAHFNH